MIKIKSKINDLRVKLAVMIGGKSLNKIIKPEEKVIQVRCDHQLERFVSRIEIERPTGFNHYVLSTDNILDKHSEDKAKHSEDKAKRELCNEVVEKLIIPRIERVVDFRMDNRQYFQVELFLDANLERIAHL